MPDRLVRAALAVLILFLLPPAFAWRKLGFRVRRDLMESPASESGPPGRRSEALVRHMSTSASWLHRRWPITPNCLSLALACQWALRLFGCRSRIRIGVRFADDGRFLSHAWLMAGDVAVTGGPLQADFRDILPADGRR